MVCETYQIPTHVKPCLSLNCVVDYRTRDLRQTGLGLGLAW